MKPYALAIAAYRDLEEIHDFIAADSLAYAHDMIVEIMTAVRRLAESPYIGRERNDLASRPVRVWNVPPYAIIYRVTKGRSIRVARVLHGARDLKTVLRESGR